MRYRPYKHKKFERNASMRHRYAKITCLILISFLALFGAGCGESGTPGGAAGPGITASISLSADLDSMPADGVTSTTITAILKDSANEPVNERTSVVFRTTRGTFRNGSQEYKVRLSDDSGSILVTLIADSASGTAEVSVEANSISQKIEVKFFDPSKIGAITLRTGAESITADGKSQVAVIATVRDNLGNPEEGATVTFKTSLGQFVEANPLPGITNRTTTADTDVDGEAAVMLVSGRTIGTAAILASINGLNTTATVTFTADQPHTITLRAAPSTIKPNGTSTLFARLLDINGNPVANQNVVFSQTVNETEGTLNVLTASTNVNGEVQSTYIGGDDEGTDILQAALFSNLDMKAQTSVTVDPGAIVIAGIDVTTGAPSIVADGKTKVNIRATVTDVDGSPAGGKTVTFTTTAGTIPATAKTDDEYGIANVMLQSSTIAGPVTIRAECDGFIDEAVVQFVPGPAHHIIMYAFPDTVPPKGPFQTAAIVQDQYDNRIDDQRLILQVRRAGHPEIVDTAEMTPEQAEDGVYRFDWTAARAYGEGNLEITARVNAPDGKVVSKTVTVVVDETATIVGGITVIAGAEEIKADGTSSVLIRATVLDYDGAPAQGITVEFDTTLGTFSSPQKETDANGIADVILTSGTTWGTATVTANANGFLDEVDVRFTSLKAGGVSLTAMPGIVKPGGQATVIAELRDDSGAPVPNQVLYFNIYENNTNASLDNISGTTDVNGRVTVIYTAGVYLADLCGVCACSGDRIRVTLASDSSVSDTTCITVAVPNGIAGYMTLTSAADTLPADGASSTAITAVVFDTGGFPMPEGTGISFTTTMGTFPGGIDPDDTGPITSQIVLFTTDASGKIVISLIAPATGTGIATITATSGGVSQAVQVGIDSILIPPGKYLSISATKTSVKTNGTDSATITALVLDENHVPIEGITVNFASTGGMISASSVQTDENGQASIVFSSGPDKRNDIVIITAKVGTSLTADIPIVLYGTEITITPATAQLSVAPPPNIRQIVVKVKDADGAPIYNAEIVITFDAGLSDATLSGLPVAGNPFTNYAGEIILVLNAGADPGIATITAEGLNTDVTGTYTIGDPADIFQITMPTGSPHSAPADGGNVAVTVHAGGMIAGENVVFKTSFGTWDTYTEKTVVVAIDGNLDATLYLKSLQAGVATIQVHAQDTISYPTLTDSVQISFYTPASQAYDIIIDASQTNILPSTATSQYSLVIEAEVIDIYGAPVGNAIVDFYLSNTTGGGEYIFPVSAITDATGIARTTFTSGTLSTGSDPGSAVLVTARVATPMGCTNEVMRIMCVAEGPPLNNNDYFTISQTTADYYVWYNIGGAGTDPAPGGTGIEVSIPAGASQCAVTSATEAAIDAVAGFDAYSTEVEKTTILCVADSSQSLLSTYFTISRPGINYYVWYYIGSIVAADLYDPAPAGRTGIRVDILEDDTANAVAQKTQATLNAISGFTATVSTNMVTVTSAGPVVNHATNVNTGFTITSAQECTLFVETCGDVTDAADVNAGFTINVVTQGEALTHQEDTVAIVITGGVANVSIGYASEISSSVDNTLYLQAISVLVADTNGNPVSGALVSLGLKPSRFRTGYWVKMGDEWVVVLDNPCDAFSPTTPYIFVNEDLNNNAYLDGNEDQLTSYSVGAPNLPDYFAGYVSGNLVPGLNDGRLTPGQSVAGTIPSSAQTDANGVASFILTYQKEYAVWVEDQITATAMVFGTEYITKSRKWLPISADEEEIIANAFPQSSFNDLPCGEVP